MKTAQQILQQIKKTALQSCGVFDAVLVPSDDRRDNLIMREPAAAIYVHSTKKTIDDKGVKLTEFSFQILMKFLSIGLNDPTEDIQIVTNALAELEPVSITQPYAKKRENKRSSAYELNVSFVGCRS